MRAESAVVERVAPSNSTPGLSATAAACASSGGASKYNSSLVCREESSDFLGERPAQQQTGYPSSKEINESLERAKYIVDKAVKNKKVRH